MSAADGPRASARAPAVAARPPAFELAAAFASIYLVWGSTFLAIRYAVETIPPFAMMAVRCLLGGGILLGIALVRERGIVWPTRREWGGALVLGAFLFVGCHGVLAYAEERVPSGIAALCLATIPLFVPLLAWALPGGSPPSRRRVGGARGRIRRRGAAGRVAGNRRRPAPGRRAAPARKRALVGGGDGGDPGRARAALADDGRGHAPARRRRAS